MTEKKNMNENSSHIYWANSTS